MYYSSLFQYFISYYGPYTLVNFLVYLFINLFWKKLLWLWFKYKVEA